jgi:cysteine desulfurase
MELPVYLDHAATTPVAPEVFEAMLPYFSEVYGNPASIYAAGAEARDAVDAARESIARAIGADPDEIFFTSGGTEADNWAIKGMAATADQDRRHLLVSAVEHHAVLDTCESLRPLGFDVEIIPVDSLGLVEPAEISKRIRRETLLVTVMHANNEVGTIQPVREIGAICREAGVPFHSDAVQTLGKVEIDVEAMGASLLSLSAHKVYGPKGIGALYARRGTRIGRFMEGGEQERGKRAGTLNVPGIVGFRGAVDLALSVGGQEHVRIAALRDRLIAGIEGGVDRAWLMGPRKSRLANNAHFCFDGVEGESLLLALDQAGIYASAGSACTTGSVEPSHVLIAMGVTVERARGALRLTLGRSTTEEAVDYTVEHLGRIVRDLRALAG